MVMRNHTGFSIVGILLIPGVIVIIGGAGCREPANSFRHQA
jgi:hypothetical protein